MEESNVENTELCPIMFRIGDTIKKRVIVDTDGTLRYQAGDIFYIKLFKAGTSEAYSDWKQYEYKSDGTIVPKDLQNLLYYPLSNPAFVDVYVYVGVTSSNNTKDLSRDIKPILSAKHTYVSKAELTITNGFNLVTTNQLALLYFTVNVNDNQNFSDNLFIDLSLDKETPYVLKNSITYNPDQLKIEATNMTRSSREWKLIQPGTETAPKQAIRFAFVPPQEVVLGQENNYDLIIDVMDDNTLQDYSYHINFVQGLGITKFEENKRYDYVININGILNSIPFSLNSKAELFGDIKLTNISEL